MLSSRRGNNSRAAPSQPRHGRGQGHDLRSSGRRCYGSGTPTYSQGIVPHPAQDARYGNTGHLQQPREQSQQHYPLQPLQINGLTVSTRPPCPRLRSPPPPAAPLACVVDRRIPPIPTQTPASRVPFKRVPDYSTMTLLAPDVVSDIPRLFPPSFPFPLASAVSA